MIFKNYNFRKYAGKSLCHVWSNIPQHGAEPCFHCGAWVDTTAYGAVVCFPFAEAVGPYSVVRRGWGSRLAIWPRDALALFFPP